MRLPIIIPAIAFLSACSREVPPDAATSAKPQSDLEAAAIDAGVIPDLKDISLSGRYEKRSDIGTDKFCSLPNGDGYDIGILASFGPGAQCEGQGTASISGEAVKIKMRGKGNCHFNAVFDGVEIRMPGSVPDGCNVYCTDRASLAGVRIPLVEDGERAARGMKGREIDLLCG